jgi:hypothetical protein
MEATREQVLAMAMPDGDVPSDLDTAQ